MATTSQDLDLAVLLADTEAEIVRLVQDRDPSTRGLYEMVRYHLALDGSGASGGKRIRPLLGLLAYASIAGDHRLALPGAAAVELGHNFSLVHDDIEDGDTERRHRATLWAIHGVPQAINAGDALFSLSRIALHRLTDLGNSVIIIEHNLDVIRSADWIIDLGPEGGEEGGRIVAQGTPEQVARVKKSYTGQALNGAA